MKLKTLNHIHRLLIENENATKKAKEMTYDALCKAEDEGAENYEALQNVYDNMRKAYNEALYARIDFEDREW